MENRKNLERGLILAALVLAAITGSAAQTVDLTLDDYQSLTLIQSGGNVGGTQMENAYIGIYSFDLTYSGSIPGLSQASGATIDSVCLGPLGTLTTGTYQYNYETFGAANPGINPSSWAWNQNAARPQYWGIQNANYLWLTESATVEENKDATGAAALALAMYDALYNSTAYGQITSTPQSYFVPAFVSTAEQTDYNNDVNALNPASVMANLASGSVFVPIDTAEGGPSGQEFIILDNPPSPNLSVPEPTTIIVGVLLALPFTASTLRIVRGKRIQ